MARAQSQANAPEGEGADPRAILARLEEADKSDREALQKFLREMTTGLSEFRSVQAARAQVMLQIRRSIQGQRQTPPQG